MTIVEVLMATTILGVGFIGVIQGLTAGSEILDTARKQQVATQLVAAEVERLRTGSWAVIAGLPASATIAIGESGAISGDQAFFALCNYSAAAADDDAALAALAKGFTIRYDRTWLRPASASSSTVTFVKVAYTISWKGNTGRAHSRQSTADFGRNGLHLSNQKS